MKLDKIGYSLRDVTIIQSVYSEQNHRSDVNPCVKICNRDVLPIFVAPMASVTDENNYQTWLDNKVTPVIPRSIQTRLSFLERVELSKKTFVSFSLEEANGFYSIVKNGCIDTTYYICIDIAHGTLSALYDICKKLKDAAGDNVIIMSGNIANPKAYRKYCECGIDYVRCGIGGGSRCTSSANVGLHYPMASLLADIYTERELIESYNRLCDKNGGTPLKITKVVADGGIYWFDEINKALALGADAVMIGRAFAECDEACGEIFYSASENDYLIGNYLSESEYVKYLEGEHVYGDFYIPNYYDDPKSYKRFREYYGMSTRKAQVITGGEGNKTSEGINKPVEVKYPVSKWLNNAESYLRSAMTYTNSATIAVFNRANCIILGGMTYQTYSK